MDWVNENIENILEYDNGILLRRAKDKLLFLAFCMEFKRFYEFYTNESSHVFETYFPIQLDATCNGFQHMALLSNEERLFKELNLDKKTAKDNPNDFYTFLLHKIINKFETQLSKGIEIETKSGGNYKRLSKFVWDRSYIKKVIMTIPYNVSTREMKNYLLSNFYKVEYDEVNKITWYS